MSKTIPLLLSFASIIYRKCFQDMLLMNPIFFTSPAHFRDWLAENHASVDEVWIGFYKKSAEKTGISYKESVDEALCFGWIDGIRKTIDEHTYTNRFTPRRKGSNWSSVNIKRVGELIEAGLMQPPGLKAFESRDSEKSQQYSFEAEERRLSAEYEAIFQENAKAWEFFQSQPPGYQKGASWWVISAKQEATRLKRLATLIDDSANGQRIALLRR